MAEERIALAGLPNINPITFLRFSGRFFLFLKLPHYMYFAKTLTFLLICLILLVPTTLQAQYILVLQKGENQKTRITYKQGESITYKQRDVEGYMTDRIIAIEKDIIELGENVLLPRQIEVVDISEKDERNQTLRNLTLLPLGAGGLLLTAETVNSLYSEGRVSISEPSLMVSGGLLFTGLIVSQLRYKRFRHKNKRTIKILSFEEWEESLEED